MRPVLVFLAVAALCGTLSNLTAGPTRRLKWIGDWQVPVRPTPTPAAGAVAATPVASSTAPEAIEIGTAQAIAEHAQGALFLDARPSESYQEKRVPGARPFAAWESETDEKVVALMSELPPGARMVVYCTGGKCEDSHVVRGKLLAAGFTNVVVDKDGIPGWEAAGQPLEK